MRVVARSPDKLCNRRLFGVDLTLKMRVRIGLLACRVDGFGDVRVRLDVRLNAHQPIGDRANRGALQRVQLLLKRLKSKRKKVNTVSAL